MTIWNSAFKPSEIVSGLTAGTHKLAAVAQELYSSAHFQASSRADLIATDFTEVDAHVDYCVVAGYASAGDGGWAFYKRVVPEPSHPGKVQSADGTWWEMVAVHGHWDIRQFGAKVDGVTDDHDAIIDAIETAIATGVPIVWFPAGTTMLGSEVLKTGISSDLCLAGAGAASIIKRIDNALTGNFQSMFNLQPATGAGVNFSARGLQIDGNGRANGIAMAVTGVTGTFQVGETITGDTSGAKARITRVSGATLYVTAYQSSFSAGETLTGGTSGATATGPTPAVSPFAWQQSHCIAAISDGTDGWRSVVFSDVEVRDATGGGLYASTLR